VESDTGIPNSYISAIEKGHKSPGLKTLTRLASYYEVPLQDLLQTAGLTQPIPSQADETSVLDVERSYAYVVADLNLNFVKPARHMPIDAQRYVVEMYQFYTGRKLL
jgi:transcriptional regulator with XRE-family HTH domain